MNYWSLNFPADVLMAILKAACAALNISYFVNICKRIFDVSLYMELAASQTQMDPMDFCCLLLIRWIKMQCCILLYCGFVAWCIILWKHPVLILIWMFRGFQEPITSMLISCSGKVLQMSQHGVKKIGIHLTTHWLDFISYLDLP